MAASPTQTKPRWALVTHGLEHRESNVRRAHRQLKRRFPGISEDEVSDHYEAVLIERVAMPPNPDGTWPSGAFERDDTQGLDAWIVKALFFELSNYQRHRVSRRESLDEAPEDDRGESQLLLADTRLDPAAVAEDRDTLDTVARDAPAEVQTYLLLAQAGYRRADIQRATAWSTSKYKWIKAKSEGFVRGRYLSLPAFIGRWASSMRARGGAIAIGGGAGAVKTGTALVVGIAVVGGAALEIDHPTHHRAHHHAAPALATPRAAIAPTTVPAAPAPAVRSAPSSSSTAAKRAAAARAKAAAAATPGLAYLGAPASQTPSQSSSAPSSSPTRTTPMSHATRSGGLAYLGGP
jgi:hypothetical protein